MKDPKFLEMLRSYSANLQIVIAFRMMPEVVWNMPIMGTFNLHASLLPQYRGAAPINWAVINGENKTGVTTFFLKHEIDTGNILLQREVGIGPDETAGELHDKLMQTGAGLVVETLDAIVAGKAIETEQQTSAEYKHAPKIFKPDCEISWNKTVAEVHNLIRGLSPYPAAYTMLQGKSAKIFKAEIVGNDAGLKPGEISSDGKSFIHIGCAEGAVSLLELQAEGKKRMGVGEYLRGNWK